MLLICLLGVILVIGGLTLRRELGTMLTEARFALFGAHARARMAAKRPEAVAPHDPPSQLGCVPPPPVVTRPRC
jgi:hypothetical protein